MREIRGNKLFKKGVAEAWEARTAEFQDMTAVDIIEDFQRSFDEKILHLVNAKAIDDKGIKKMTILFDAFLAKMEKLEDRDLMISTLENKYTVVMNAENLIFGMNRSMLEEDRYGNVEVFERTCPLEDAFICLFIIFIVLPLDLIVLPVTLLVSIVTGF